MHNRCKLRRSEIWLGLLRRYVPRSRACGDPLDRRTAARSAADSHRRLREWGGHVPIHIQNPAIVTDVSRLPAPVASVWEWQLDAACREIDNTVFFHPARERGSAKEERDRRAKEICAGCPVIESCRRHALTVREPYGVWGGLTANEREQIRRSVGRDTAPRPRR